jgi:hypothetical protein
MFKKILSSLGMGGNEAAPPAPPPASGGFAPYKNDAFNHIYNLLFCDKRELFRGPKVKEEGPWIVLADDAPADALRAVAEDELQESRLRVLAYNRLREKGESVPTKKLLGVVVEVGLEDGLDVLAAYADGRARYINQVESMSVFETAPPEIAAKIPPLLAAAQQVVDQIGPWDKERLAPPHRGTIRLSFLVSDGLYFGQGPLEEFQRDPKAGPVIAATLALLNAIVDQATGKSESAQR